MSMIKEIPADWPCDRCGHPSKRHAAPVQFKDKMGTKTSIFSGCLVVESSIPYTQRGRTFKAKQCFCDGYWPR